MQLIEADGLEYLFIADLIVLHYMLPPDACLYIHDTPLTSGTTTATRVLLTPCSPGNVPTPTPGPLDGNNPRQDW